MVSFDGKTSAMLRIARDVGLQVSVTSWRQDVVAGGGDEVLDGKIPRKLKRRSNFFESILL